MTKPPESLAAKPEPVSEQPAPAEAPECAASVAVALTDEVMTALYDAQMALSWCGKAQQATALRANALRRIKAVLEKVGKQ